jgi:hypothetical protein
VKRLRAHQEESLRAAEQQQQADAKAARAAEVREITTHKRTANSIQRMVLLNPCMIHCCFTAVSLLQAMAVRAQEKEERAAAEKAALAARAREREEERAAAKAQKKLKVQIPCTLWKPMHSMDFHSVIVWLFLSRNGVPWRLPSAREMKPGRRGRRRRRARLLSKRRSLRGKIR